MQLKINRDINWLYESIKRAGKSIKEGENLIISGDWIPVDQGEEEYIDRECESWKRKNHEDKIS